MKITGLILALGGPLHCYWALEAQGKKPWFWQTHLKVLFLLFSYYHSFLSQNSLLLSLIY